jgi:Ca2+-binding RTX toxin-like protein
MSIFGAIGAGIVAGPFVAALVDLVSGSSVIGTGQAPADPPPPPFSNDPLPAPFTGQGTSGDDVVRIRKFNDELGAPLYDVEINGEHFIVSKEKLESTVFDLGDGNDKLIVDADVDANITARGGNGDDELIGGKGNDHLDGGAGDDVLIGRDGNDTLLGRGGSDHLQGDGGRDSLDGGTGYNTLVHDIADFTAPIQFANPKLFWDYADIASTPSNRATELSRK